MGPMGAWALPANVVSKCDYDHWLMRMKRIYAEDAASLETRGRSSNTRRKIPGSVEGPAAYEKGKARSKQWRSVGAGGAGGKHGGLQESGRSRASRRGNHTE